MGVISQTDLVRDAMTPEVLSADVNAPIEELARMTTSRRIHRLIIAQDGKLAGIATSMDLLRTLPRLVARARRPRARGAAVQPRRRDYRDGIFLS